jgi:hypothetical protein
MITFFGDTENIDNWPSVEASEQFVDNLIALVDRGYLGVQVKYSARPGGGGLLSLAFDLATPEGRLVQFLWHIASRGRQQPTAEIMSVLERVYREQSLPLPARPH